MCNRLVPFLLFPPLTSINCLYATHSWRTHIFLTDEWRQTFQAGVKRGKHLLLAPKVSTLQARVSNAIMLIISRDHGKTEQRTSIFQHPNSTHPAAVLETHYNNFTAIPVGAKCYLISISKFIKGEAYPQSLEDFQSYFLSAQFDVTSENSCCIL